MSALAWYRDRDARVFVALRYLPWLAALSLGWEIAHVRLYTLWKDAEPGYIAFSVFHCTAGDVLIGGAALLLALVIGRARALAHWPWGRVAVLTVAFGAGYTVFSEWMNVKMLRSWEYADAMPTIDLAGFELGLTPLAQWLAVPPLALYLANRNRREPQWRRP